jgi:hypothetical protein
MLIQAITHFMMSIYEYRISHFFIKRKISVFAFLPDVIALTENEGRFCVVLAVFY